MGAHYAPPTPPPTLSPPAPPMGGGLSPFGGGAWCSCRRWLCLAVLSPHQPRPPHAPRNLPPQHATARRRSTARRWTRATTTASRADCASNFFAHPPNPLQPPVPVAAAPPLPAIAHHPRRSRILASPPQGSMARVTSVGWCVQVGAAAVGRDGRRGLDPGVRHTRRVTACTVCWTHADPLPPPSRWGASQVVPKQALAHRAGRRLRLPAPRAGRTTPSPRHPRCAQLQKPCTTA